MIYIVSEPFLGRSFIRAVGGIYSYGWNFYEHARRLSVTIYRTIA